MTCLFPEVGHIYASVPRHAIEFLLDIILSHETRSLCITIDQVGQLSIPVTILLIYYNQCSTSRNNTDCVSIIMATMDQAKASRPRFHTKANAWVTYGGLEYI